MIVALIPPIGRISLLLMGFPPPGQAWHLVPVPSDHGIGRGHGRGRHGRGFSYMKEGEDISGPGRVEVECSHVLLPHLLVPQSHLFLLKVWLV